MSRNTDVLLIIEPVSEMSCHHPTNLDISLLPPALGRRRRAQLAGGVPTLALRAQTLCGSGNTHSTQSPKKGASLGAPARRARPCEPTRHTKSFCQCRKGVPELRTFRQGGRSRPGQKKVAPILLEITPVQIEVHTLAKCRKNNLALLLEPCRS